MTIKIIYIATTLVYFVFVIFLFKKLNRSFKVVRSEETTQGFEYLFMSLVSIILMVPLSNSMSEFSSIQGTIESSFLDTSKLVSMLLFVHLISSLIGSYLSLIIIRSFFIINDLKSASTILSLLIIPIAVGLILEPYVDLILSETLPQLKIKGFR